MSQVSTYPLARERRLILALLVGLAAICWVIVGQQVAMPGSMGLTAGMSAPVFLAVWVAMMVAMMFPAAAPMILMFARVSAGKRQRGQVFVPTWIFVGSYLMVWTAFGALAYVGALATQGLAARSMWVMDNAARLGGGVLILAGLYQLSPLKNLCLTKCRSPINFILNSWHDGYRGALRMGLAHGAYCLGCCWLLFAILFPLGVMNLAAMVVITLLIFGEKSLPMGREISRVAAVALVGYGGLVLVVPHLLPTVM